MGRLEACWSSKVYAFRKQYPIIREFEHRIHVVEKHLNKDTKGKKPSCENVCKNRQKR